MAEKISIEQFMLDVPLNLQEYILSLHKDMIDNDLKLEITQAAKSYVASYKDKKSKKTLFNLIFRKTGMQARIYTENIAQYLQLVNDMDSYIAKNLKDSTNCKQCSAKCTKGYSFFINGEPQFKCRYGFILPLEDKALPYVLDIINAEIECRKAS